jgi:hypothetical protein
VAKNTNGNSDSDDAAIPKKITLGDSIMSKIG